MINFHKKVLREKANYNNFIMENLNPPFLKKIGYYYSTLTLVQCSDGYTYRLSAQTEEIRQLV